MNYVFLSPNFPSNYKHFVRQLSKQGIRILGISSDPYDSLEDDLKESLTEYYRVDDMDDYEQLLKACGYFTFKYGKIDRIESHNEHWLESDARLRTDFNVFGFKNENMGVVKYKSKMKELFMGSNVPVARGKVTLNLDEAKKFANEVGYPVCVKPDNGVGAADTYKIRSDEELEEFFKYKIDSDYIMEEFIEGEIHTFDGLVDRDGRVVFMNSFIFSNGIMETVNDDLDICYYNQTEIPDDLKSYGMDLVKSFNLKERFFHFEFFRTEDGNLIALEANLRPPGGLSLDMFNYSRDTDLYRAYARLVNGESLELELNSPKCCAYIGLKEYEGIKHKNSIEEALDRYRDIIIHHGPIASIFSAALGNYCIILRGEKIEDLAEAAEFIMKREYD